MAVQNSNSEVSCKACVLAVDDDVKILRFLQIGLRLAGYKVVVTTSGEEALRLQGSERPDIMLLDIFMPNMNGFEVLRKLRAASGLPVIALSAHASAAHEALQMGANDFLAKPFMADELTKRIEALLYRSG